MESGKTTTERPPPPPPPPPLPLVDEGDAAAEEPRAASRKSWLTVFAAAPMRKRLQSDGHEREGPRMEGGRWMG